MASFCVLAASAKSQLDELKKPNPRYALELHTIRGMILCHLYIPVNINYDTDRVSSGSGSGSVGDISNGGPDSRTKEVCRYLGGQRRISKMEMMGRVFAGINHQGQTSHDVTVKMVQRPAQNCRSRGTRRQVRPVYEILNRPWALEVVVHHC
jgi:hypothetical protein